MRDFSSDHRWLSLNTATVRKQGDLVEIIDACAKHGIRAIDPWRDQVAAVGLDRAARAVRDAGLELSGYCRGGMFTSDASRRTEVRDDNRRCVDEAKALGASCIVLVVGGLPQYSRPGSEASKDIVAARGQVEEALAEMLDYAKQAKLPLAIEPLHPMYADSRSAINTLAQANDLALAIGSDYVGVAVDVYHLWWDPALESEILRAGRAGKLFAYHVCDWKTPTEDLLLDRGLPGEGCIPLRSIRGWVEAAGFRGFNEVEIFSKLHWQSEQTAYLDRIVQAYRDHV